MQAAFSTELAVYGICHCYINERWRGGVTLDLRSTGHVLIGTKAA